MVTVFLIPSHAGERAAGQRRQTVFVVVLAVVLEDSEAQAHCAAPRAGSPKTAKVTSQACIWVFSRSWSV